MCGIAGFCDFECNLTREKDKWTDILIKMRESIAHRGEDQTGEFLDKNAGLCHSRLSIRDISNGRQPMVKTVDGAKYVIVYNGEIYNTEELNKDLKEKGYVFKTTSDTETILNCYIEYGHDCVEKLNGIFAFSIWDQKEQTLTLFRDRVGIKPLFYSVTNNSLVFGSEQKALFCHPYITPEVDDDSFREIFGIGPARTSGCGVFKGINEVLPGCFIVFSNNNFKQVRYWDFVTREHTDSYNDTVDKVAFLVKDAITRQMVSDVPVCTFLSGGLDSSIVTAIASDYLNKSGSTLNTFSFDFKGNDDYFESNSFQPTRDRPFVDIMLKYVKVNHSYLECDESILADMLYDAMISKDLPGMTDIDASLMYFCSIVKKHNKVVLTGECADEIFGGYPWFYREELLNAETFPWSSNMESRVFLLKEDVVKKLGIKEYADMRYKESLSQVTFTDKENAFERRRREVSYLNQKWFMQTLLDRMDRSSMAYGLEARVPFADHRIVEYMYNVPWEMKYRDGVEKSILREACKELLPHELLYRKKSPYPKTYNPNYEMILAKKFSKIVNDKSSPLNRFLDKEKCDMFLKSPKDHIRPWFGQLMAGPQMMAYLIQINDWMIFYDL